MLISKQSAQGQANVISGHEDVDDLAKNTPARNEWTKKVKPGKKHTISEVSSKRLDDRKRLQWMVFEVQEDGAEDRDHGNTHVCLVTHHQTNVSVQGERT